MATDQQREQPTGANIQHACCECQTPAALQWAGSGRMNDISAAAYFSSVHQSTERPKNAAGMCQFGAEPDGNFREQYTIRPQGKWQNIQECSKKLPRARNQAHRRKFLIWPSSTITKRKLCQSWSAGQKDVQRDIWEVSQRTPGKRWPSQPNLEPKAALRGSSGRLQGIGSVRIPRASGLKFQSRAMGVWHPARSIQLQKLEGYRQDINALKLAKSKCDSQSGESAREALADTIEA